MRHGYGRVGVKGERVLAHRKAWELSNGRTLHPDEVIMHSCDNPPCVNPAHLSPGSQRDNIDDMHQKGRHSHGERVCGAKFDADTILEVRKRSAEGERHRDIADDLGISPQHISSIVYRRSWKHI